MQGYYAAYSNPPDLRLLVQAFDMLSPPCLLAGLVCVLVLAPKLEILLQFLNDLIHALTIEVWPRPRVPGLLCLREEQQARKGTFLVGISQYWAGRGSGRLLLCNEK